MRFIAVLLLVAIVSPAHSAGPEMLTWSELPDPAAKDYDDPFRALGIDQLESLRKLAQLQKRLKQAGLPEPERQETADAIARETAELSKVGIDANALIAKRWEVADLRRRAATAGNPAIDGKMVELAGFTLPSSTGTNSFFIVPDPMKCSHVSPPVPNQVVHISDRQGLLPRDYFVPVRIVGKIRIEPTSDPVFLLDGPRNIPATFAFDLDAVEVLGKSRPPQPASIESRSFMSGAIRSSP